MRNFAAGHPRFLARANVPMPNKILSIVHSEQGRGGRVVEKLEQRGFIVEHRHPLAGDSLPASMDGYAGAVSFGGPMSANDDGTLPGIRTELDWIPVALGSGKPFLGVCLGAQMIARALGASVRPHPRGLAEIGYAAVRPTAAGHALFDGGLEVYHWHLEGFDLPAGAVLLARGERFPNQAYRYGDRAYGIQFHPEVTRSIMERWLDKGAHRLALPGAQTAPAQRAAHLRCDGRLAQWLDAFLDGWLASRA